MLGWHSHDRPVKLPAAHLDQSKFHYVGKKNLTWVYMKGLLPSKP